MDALTLPGEDPDSPETCLEYRFQNPDYLRQALTHRSAPPPEKDRLSGSWHNERLEFLGDSVLDLVIAELLHERFPKAAEGLLSGWRASLVNTRSLGELSAELGLGERILFGRGEAMSGGREKKSILGSALEAILGAIFLDGGYGAARQVVDRLFSPRLKALEKAQEKDYKTLLQEHLQARGEPLPSYEVTAVDGPPHARIFSVRCHVIPLPSGEGNGSSKRRAEQEAAREMLLLLQDDARKAV
ncbi:MAG: ribonuclease III [Magnetococcales bacterium]|nr:ribonuclease III [Magnetococcales bacterium]